MMPYTDKRMESHDPHNTPRWLWDLAGEIATMKRTPSRFRRRTILMAAVRHLRAAAGRRGKSVPTIEEALRIYDADAPLRWELEARLLTGQDDEQISARCGIPPEVVEAYAELFLDVRGRLDADGWIATRVIGPGLHRGFKADEVAGLWKAVAHDRGVGVLDAVVEAFRASRRDDDPPTLDVYFAAESAASLGMRANIAAMTLPPGKRTQAGLGVIFGRLAKIKQTPPSRARDEQESRLAADIARLYREGPEFLLDGETGHDAKIAFDDAGQAASSLTDGESRPARPNPLTRVDGSDDGDDVPALANTSTDLSRRGDEASNPELTPRLRVGLAKAKQGAAVVDQVAFAAGMAAAVPLGEKVNGGGYKLYLDKLLEEAGNPSDPMERVLVQQVALAHHRIVRLHGKAEEAKTTEAMKGYAAAATRLTGELRRLVLAIRQYRQPTSTKHFTVVRQQNVSSNQQQIAYLDHSAKQNEAPSNRGAIEQGSKRLMHGPTDSLPTESEAGGRRPPQPQAARPADR